MKRFTFLLLLTFVFSISIRADIPRPQTPKPTPTPKPEKSVDTTLMIRIDKTAKEAKLIIPKSQVKQLRAQLEELDGEPDSTTAVAGNFTRTQTIVSGLFMSLAFLFGGVWFARSRKDSKTGAAAAKAGKATIIGAVLFLCASVATIAFANAGPPAEARSITGRIFSPSVHMYNFASGRIKLETSTDSDDRSVQLIVPDVKDDARPNGD